MDAGARVVRLVSAPGLSEESATADGGESGSAGPGGVEKGGLLAALRAEGIRRGEAVVFANEMRLGLLRQVRRMWGRRGEKQRRRIELRYAWVYWVLDVDAMRGRLWRDWVKRVRGVEIAQVLRAWKEAGVKGVVWDHAAFHKGSRWERWSCGGYINPPYSPESCGAGVCGGSAVGRKT